MMIVVIVPAPLFQRAPPCVHRRSALEHREAREGKRSESLQVFDSTNVEIGICNVTMSITIKYYYYYYAAINVEITIRYILQARPRRTGRLGREKVAMLIPS